MATADEAEEAVGGGKWAWSWMLPQPETICQLPYSVEREEPERTQSAADLLPGTANGLLPVRVPPCSDWLEEEELEDLASLSG